MRTITCTFVLTIMLIAADPGFGQPFDVLIYTSPDRLPDRTTPVAMAEFRKMAEQNHFRLNWAQSEGNADTTDPFSDEYLEQVEAVVFLHSRGYDLSYVGIYWAATGLSVTN